jgi:hypothetical protein
MRAMVFARSFSNFEDMVKRDAHDAPRMPVDRSS